MIFNTSPGCFCGSQWLKINELGMNYVECNGLILHVQLNNHWAFPIHIKFIAIPMRCPFPGICWRMTIFSCPKNTWRPWKRQHPPTWPAILSGFSGEMSWLPLHCPNSWIWMLLIAMETKTRSNISPLKTTCSKNIPPGSWWWATTCWADKMPMPFQIQQT